MAASPSQRTFIGLLRHGETVWNREKRIQGSGNSPLTAEGIAMSRAWGQHLITGSTKWHRIVASPLPRAVQTAELVNESLHLPLMTDQALREKDWGRWEGLTLVQIEQNYPELLESLTKHGWDFKPPGGESRRALLQRVLGGLQCLRQRFDGENLLLVSHLGVIKSLLYHIEGRDFLPNEPKILYKNRFHIISCENNEYSIVSKNMTVPGQE